MLRELIYGILNGMTNLFKGIWLFDDLFDIERNWFGRLIMKIWNLIGWTLFHLFMISMTGGLWLMWIGIKMIFRRKKSKHNKKQTKKNRRRA